MQSHHLFFIITRYWPIIGGAELHTRELIRHLTNRHQVTVITQMNGAYHHWVRRTTILAPSKKKIYEDGWAKIVRLGISPVEKLILLPFVLYYAATRQLNQTVLTRIIGRKIEEYAIDIDLVHAIHTGAYYLDWLAYDVAQKKGVPFVITLYTHPSEKGLASLHRLYRVADALIAMTNHERAWLINEGVNPSKIFVTGGGPIIESSQRESTFRERHRFHYKHMVLFLGQKFLYKGYQTLLKATQQVWQTNPDVGFVFIGPQYPDSNTVFQGISDSRILELGQVSEQEKIEALQACDVLCVPSSEESLGMVFLEAWSFVKPVIGGDIPVLREIIEDGVDGYLVEQNPSQIAKRLIELLGDENLRLRMGQNGYNKATTNYSWTNLAKKTELVYQYVLNK